MFFFKVGRWVGRISTFQLFLFFLGINKRLPNKHKKKEEFNKSTYPTYPCLILKDLAVIA
jgi:hypothetical protein